MNNESLNRGLKDSPKDPSQVDGAMNNKELNEDVEVLAMQESYVAAQSEISMLEFYDIKQVDFVLVEKKVDPDVVQKDSMLKLQSKLRDIFERKLLKEGISIEKRVSEDVIYILLHCPFKRLCMEAERVKLEMPIKHIHLNKTSGECCHSYLSKLLESDENAVKQICAPFFTHHLQIYENYADHQNFFRPGLRSLLVYHILINTDIRYDKEIMAEDLNDSILLFKYKPELRTAEGRMQTKGLSYLLMKKVYIDGFTLHDESVLDAVFDDMLDLKHKGMLTLSRFYNPKEDIRNHLNDEWTKLFKLQPIWKVRCYFGEKIAFYFAWTGMLTTTLLFPMVFGLVILVYGTYQSAIEYDDEGVNVTALIKRLRRVFDNKATPFFALFMCCWGTVFLEIWKRHSARLAFEWSVDSFELDEPNRPQYYGTKVKQDPVTEEDIWYYPSWVRITKFLASVGIILFMVALVISSVSAIIVYRSIINIDYCPNIAESQCFFLTTVCSSVLNGLSIQVLVYVYDKLAVVLTDWGKTGVALLSNKLGNSVLSIVVLLIVQENYRTQTDYDNALIIKLFAFRFVNSYSSCFYIAFLRESVGVIDERYVDSCQGSCMTQLTFQVMILIFTSTLPKIANDIGFSILRHFWLTFVHWYKAETLEREENQKDWLLQYIEKERSKRISGDLTLAEFTEKVILYGFLMIFAASFPLAPMFAVAICFFDVRLDASRLLRFYRRPIAHISQNIGIWFTILQFLNIVGVVSNAFLIAFTSSWGEQFNTTEKLIVVLAFEHIVFALKFILAALIPDVPIDVTLMKQKKKLMVLKRLEIDNEANNQPSPQMSALKNVDNPDSQLPKHLDSIKTSTFI